MDEALKEYLETDEGKALMDKTFEAFAEKKGYRSPDSVNGLVSKNEELIGKNKKLKETLENSQIPEENQKFLDFLKENDILDIEDLEGKLNPPGVTPPKVDETVQRELRQLKNKFATLEAENKTAKEQVQVEKGLRINSDRKSTITAELKKANVSEAGFDPMFALFNSQIITEEKEDGSFSFVTPSADGVNIPIHEKISEWSTTDLAKPFLNIPTNTGSGKQLNNGNGKATMPQAEFLGKTVEEQSIIGGQIAKGEMSLTE